MSLSGPPAGGTVAGSFAFGTVAVSVAVGTLLRPLAPYAFTGVLAVKTILGMIPLLTDAFFIAMAVTIMFGLGFATVLTLIVVPVLYTIFFRIPNTPK